MKRKLALETMTLSMPVSILSAPVEAAEIVPVQVASELSSPLFVTAPPNDTDHLYIVEQGSGDTASIRVLNLNTGILNPTPFLVISDFITGGERGLLGLAFDPNYATNGYFYVNVSVPRQGSIGNHDTVVRRYTATSPDQVDPNSAKSIIRFNQPFSNHNGGWLGFSPNDDFLYIANGDGGSANDPNNSAQDLNSLLGKIIRIDVERDDFPADPENNYGIPADNPFVASPGNDEIWAYGLRNPWRSSFDRLTGDFYIADVGQNAREEINFQSTTTAPGQNYGWKIQEGFRCADNSQANGNPPCGDPSLIDPVYDYSYGSGENQGRSVTGGYVYRGPIDELQGHYFFADFINDRIWSLEVDRTNGIMIPGSFTDWTDTFNANLANSISNISSFGEDAQGNLYIVSLQGDIFRLEENQNPPFTLDIDADGQYLANTDGLLLYGYMNIREIGVPALVHSLTQQLADSLINANSGANRTDGGAIAEYIESKLEQLDIDGDQEISAAIDGLLTYGYLNIGGIGIPALVYSLTQQLANSLIPRDSDATRATGEQIASYLESLII